MRRFKSIFGILIFASVLVSCNQKMSFQNVDQLVAEAEKSVECISVEQLMEKTDNGDMILLIDVREPNEHNAGYIPGALNIPRGVLEFKIGNEKFWEAEMLYMPEKDEELILYCKKGSRSILAVQVLEQLGYKNVKYLDDGWKKWEMTYPLIYEKNLDVMSHDDGGEVGGC